MSNKKNKELNLQLLKWCVLLTGFIAVYWMGSRLLKSDHAYVIRWSLILLAAGLSFLPSVSMLFSKFHDGGWIFSKVIGVAVSGWLTWYLSSLFLPFTRTNSMIVFLFCAVLNYGGLAFYHLVWKKDKQGLTMQWDEKKLFSAISTELLFFLAFTLWCYFRGFRPQAEGTEKFMDYALMTSMMRADSFPPVDMWLSGETINYYYMGQYMAVYLSKLAGVGAEYGYNLALMMIAAFSMTQSYSIVYNLAKNMNASMLARTADKLRNKTLLIRQRIEDRYFSTAYYVFCGLLACGAVNFASSMHYPIYKRIVPYFGKIAGKVIDNSYWFSNPTRYIGYNPESADKTIHEYPSYSFILGDLHAHVVNIMFVLTVIAILYAFLQNRKRPETINYWREAFSPAVIAVGFFIGLFNTTNYWDFPIYFVVSGAVILFSNAVRCGFKKTTFLLTAAHAAVVIGISQIVCLPFTLSFESMATGIRLTENRTLPHQMLVLWALPVLCLIIFFCAAYRVLRQEKKLLFKRERSTSKKNRKNKVIKEAGTEEAEQHCALFQFIGRLNRSDLFVATIGLCAAGLILLPEIIYVKDIYPSHLRANTMFKLVYQAFIMFGLSMGYILPKLVLFMRKKRFVFPGIFLLFCLFWTMGYTKEAFSDWYGNVLDSSGYKGLNAAAFAEETLSSDYEAINWLNENTEGLPVVLEANGDSYSLYQRVSVLTGLPTLLGWRDHEWLWRSGKGDDPFGLPEVVRVRREDIQTIYTSADRNEVQSLLGKYDVEYVYIGKYEREKFENLNQTLLVSLGHVVFENLSAQENETTLIIQLY